MTTLLQDPIKPGDIHKFRMTHEAFSHKHSIDYIYDNEILLHIKPILEHSWVAVNDFIDGRWREEIRIPISEESLRDSLNIILTFHPMHIAIRIEGYPEFIFQRNTPFLESTAIDFPRTVEFMRLEQAAEITQLSKAEQPEKAESKPFAAAQSPSPTPQNAARSGGGAIAPGVDGSISVADVMHLAGEIKARSLPAGAHLLALVDGRVCGSVQLKHGREAGAPHTWTFSIEYSDSAVVADGMMAELMLEIGGQRRPLARTTIKSIFVGGLDRCSESLVRGWACNPNLPTRPVLVDIFLNDKFQGSVRCDRSRDDLRKLGQQYAASGFLFKFPKSVFLPESSDTAIFARVHNTEIELQFSPWWICRRVRLEQSIAERTVTASTSPAKAWQAA